MTGANTASSSNKRDLKSVFIDKLLCASNSLSTAIAARQAAA